MRELISTGRYDEDIAKYITGLLELKFQGMPEDIDIREKLPTHPTLTWNNCTFKFCLLITIILTLIDIHAWFPMKILKNTNQNIDIDNDLITVNNFFAHFVKEVNVTKYGSDKELIPTFSPCEIHQYSDAMLKHLAKDALKTIEKTHFYSKEAVYYNDVNIDRRNHNGGGLTTTGMNATQIAILKNTMLKT